MSRLGHEQVTVLQQIRTSRLLLLPPVSHVHQGGGKGVEWAEAHRPRPPKPCWLVPDIWEGAKRKMGLFRKMASVSTLGGINYRSKREKIGMAAKAEAELAKEQAKLVRKQRKAVKG